MFEKIFSNRITTVVFTRWTVDHMSKANEHPGSGFPKQILFQIQSIFLSLLPNASKLVLHYGVGKMYPNLRSSLVPTTIRAVQLDHFKLLFENESTSPDNMAEVCEGMTSQDVWHETAKSFEDSSVVVQRSSVVAVVWR